MSRFCSWFDKLTTSDVSRCTLILSLSKDEPVLLVVRQAHHERCFSMHAHPEPVERMSRFCSWFDKLTTSDVSRCTLILSLSKDEPFCSWFDKLTTSDVSLCTLILSLSKDEPFCSWFDKLTTSDVSLCTLI